MLQRGPSVLALALMLIASALILTACGDGDGERAPTAGVVDGSGVPELEDGLLSVGSDISHEPFEFYQEGTEIEVGLDIDLAKALAEALAVEVEFLNAGFKGIIPALQEELFDISISAMPVTDERSEQIDFVPYISVGMGILVPGGNPRDVQGLEDLCGLVVAVEAGSTQERVLEDQAEACGEAMEIVPFDNNELAVEDLRAGGSDASFSDFPVAARDAAQSDGDLEVVETQIAPEPYGIGVRKESTELRDVIADALQAVMDSGKYDQILADWGLEAVALQ